MQNGPSSESKSPDILEPGNVGYLSASCCDPSAITADEQLVKNVKEAMRELGLDLELHKETLTSAQALIGSVGSVLDAKQTGVINKVMTLFATEGLKGFPMLFINGELAFNGKIPSPADIAEFMRSNLTGSESVDAHE